MFVAAVNIGALEHRRFDAGLYQIVHHLADQRLGDGDARDAGGGADGGVQPLNGEGGIAGFTVIVDGHIGDLIHLPAGGVAGGAACGVLHAGHGDDPCALCFGGETHFHRNGITAGVGDDHDGILCLHPVQLHQ